uniref:ATPase AAA-type core domain-containing protein n=1 Tax=Bionectria ochroleuca TaxID=29856 RepID=A0A8H7TQL4_BIOOC
MSPYEANLNQRHEEANLRSDPSEASSKPGPSEANSNPDPSGASSKPGPSEANLRSDPSEVSSKPDSSEANLRSDPSGASSKPGPSEANSNPDPSGASSKPGPSEANLRSDPSEVSSKPDSSEANLRSDPSGASSKPGPSEANSNPDPSEVNLNRCHFIAIAGHICNEWTTWPTTSHRICHNGGRIQERSLKCTHQLGGAPLLNKFLSEARDYHEHEVIATNQQGHQESNNKLLIDLIPKKFDPTKYQLEKYRHFPESCTLYFPQCDTSFRTRILVIEEPPAPSDYVEGSAASYENFLTKANPQLTIYKMNRPLADGELWRTIRLSTNMKTDEEATKNLIVIVDADDLRAEGVELSRHLSWERTADDFVRHIASNGQHGTLVSCAHLIVQFGCEGAIYYQGQKKRSATLLCSSEKAEGDFIQSQSVPTVCLSTAFTAGLVSSLAKDTQSQDRGCFHTLIKRGIVLGLWNANRLASEGFWRRNIENRETPCYPSLKITNTITPENLMEDEKIVYTEIPTDRSLRGERWSILNETIGDIMEAGYRVIKTGPRKVLSHVPTASFGQLITADKNEIESFHSITNLVREYLRASPMSLAKPLSIGVFGPPGSGKSFGVMQVIETAARGRNVEKLSFNLSQFANYSELVVAFQSIRDRTLSGVLPLVLFDEFDADLPGSVYRWGWLKYFLSPMQDGKFLDHGTMRPLGAAIFVFIGGTSPTFAAFKRINNDFNSIEFSAAKGPDFISRLRGYVDVVGTDPPDDVVGTDPSDDDQMYPIRRAILLRALLEKRFDIEHGEEIKVDPTVVHGLLKIQRFHHGARSLEAILSMSRLQAQREFQRAALPSEPQLTLHVNSQEFMEHVRRRRNLPPDLCERIAQRLHEVFMAEMRSQGNLETNQESNADSSMVPWDNLPPHLKESNRLAADDIVIKLRMIQCYMTRERPQGKIEVREFR